MRRCFFGLLIGLIIFGIGACLAWEKALPPANSGVFSSSDRAPITYRWETFSSPLEAATEFNMQLQQATDYLEFTPCFDESGRRTGERAVMLFSPPRVPEATWRIVWTRQSESFSETFWVESVSLSGARYFETERQGWKKCVAKMHGLFQPKDHAGGAR